MMYPSQIRNAEVVEAHCAFRATTKCVGSTRVRRGALEDNQGRNGGAYRCKPCAMAAFHTSTAHLRPPTSVTRRCPVCVAEFSVCVRQARRVERAGRAPCCSVGCGRKQSGEANRVLPKHAQRFAKTSWTNMNVRCGNGRYRRDTKKNASYASVLILMTREKFFEWCVGQAEQIALLARPSIDRLRKDGHYSIDNIQVIELVANIAKDKVTFRDGMGTCFACRKTKTLEKFVVDGRRQATGRSTICISCERLRWHEKSQGAKAARMAQTVEPRTLGASR